MTPLLSFLSILSLGMLVVGCFRFRSLRQGFQLIVLLPFFSIPTQLGAEESAPKKIAKGATFNLRAVHPKNSSLAFAVAEGTASRPPGYELLQEQTRDRDGQIETDQEGKIVTQPILVKRRAIVKGSQIADAFPDFSRPGVMSITLTKDGAAAMRKYTATITPGRDRMAYVLDGKVISAPGFMSKNLGKHFIITGIPGGTNGVKKLCDQILAAKPAATSK